MAQIRGFGFGTRAHAHSLRGSVKPDNIAVRSRNRTSTARWSGREPRGPIIRRFDGERAGKRNHESSPAARAWILDGWGLRDDPHGNAIAKGFTNWHRMLERYPHTALDAERRSGGFAGRRYGHQRGRTHQHRSDASCRKVSSLSTRPSPTGTSPRTRPCSSASARQSERRNAALLRLLSTVAYTVRSII